MGKIWLWVGGIAAGAVAVTVALSIPDIRSVLSVATAPKSMCSDERVLDTLKQLATDRLTSTYAASRNSFLPIRDAIRDQNARYEVSGIRNLGFIEGNGGSKCGAMITVRPPAGTFSEDFNADYSVELTEDKKVWVRAKFALNR